MCAACFCCCCAPAAQDPTPIKVEAVHPSNWHVDPPMAPSVPKPVPPLVPRPAFDKEDAAQSFNGCTLVKLGPPLKSILKSGIVIKNAHCRGQRDEINADSDSLKVGGGSMVTEVNATLMNERKSVQWIDNHGKELVEVKEFEPSDSGDSDDDIDSLAPHGCTCVIQ